MIPKACVVVFQHSAAIKLHYNIIIKITISCPVSRKRITTHKQIELNLIPLSAGSKQYNV